MKFGRQIQTAAFLLVLTIYVAARCWNLTQSCLWFDEIFSVHAAEHHWNSILSFAALDLIHPPLFYILLKLWIGGGGESLFWLRLLPVVFALLAVFPFVSLCRELMLGRWTRVLALFLFAVNGSAIKYAQEVRMYSLLMCLSLFSMWLFARYFVKGKSFVPLVIVNVLMVYTHYFGWFVVLSEVILILWFQRIKWRPIVLMFGVVLVSFVPWSLAVRTAAAGGSSLGQNIGWMSRPGPREIFTFIFNIIEPFYSQASSAEAISVFRVTVPLLLIIITAAAIYSVSFFGPDRGDRRNDWFLLTFIKVPVILALVSSWLLPYSIWGTRHLIVVFPPLFIFLAVNLTSGISRRLMTAAVTFILLLSGYAFILQAGKTVPQYSWCTWEPLSSEVMGVDVGEQLPIYTVEDLVAYHLWFAVREATGSRNRVIRLAGIEGIQEDKAYFLPRGFDGVDVVDFKDVTDDKLYLAFRGLKLSDSEPPLRNFLVKGYHVVGGTEVSVGSETAKIILLEK